MKRILLLIAAFALLTGCTDDITVTDAFGEQPFTEEEEPTTEEPTFSQEQLDDMKDRYSDKLDIPEFEDETEPETEAEPETAPADDPEPETEPETEETTEEKFVPPPTPEIPELIYYLDVPFTDQDDYPTGCELVSTSMLLNFYGFEISPSDLIEEGYMDVVEVTLDDDNVLHAGDPNEAFIGDPYDSHGYGCYSGAVLKALNRVLENEFYDAVNLTGLSLSDLCMEYIDYGTPVIIWASLNMAETEVKEENTWIIDETGEEFTWVSNEHCLVLVGYDDDFYYFQDPTAGSATVYERTLAEHRYEELGRQAVAISPWDE